MTKQEVIEAIQKLYFNPGDVQDFKHNNVQIGNLLLLSYGEMGEWQIFVHPVDEDDCDDDWGYCYYKYDDEFKVVTPAEMYEMIAADYDWKY